MILSNGYLYYLFVNALEKYMEMNINLYELINAVRVLSFCIRYCTNC